MASIRVTQAERKRIALRENRRLRHADDERKLDDITKSYITLEKNLNTAKKLSDENEVEIADLQRDQSRYDTDIKELEQEIEGLTKQEREYKKIESQGLQKIDSLYDDAASRKRLEGVLTELNEAKGKLAGAKQGVAFWKDQFKKYAHDVKTDKLALKRDKKNAEDNLLAIENSITKLEEEERDLNVLIERYAPSHLKITPTPTQQPSTEKEERKRALISKCDVLKDWKEKTEMKLRQAKTRQGDFSTKITTATNEFTPIKKKKNNLESEMNRRKELEQHKHAKIMMYIQGDLIPEAVDSLKAYLTAAGELDKNRAYQQKCFTDIWFHLESKKIIEVGNYFRLRSYIEAALSNTALVSEIEKREDEILEQYGKAHIPSKSFSTQSDTHTERLKTLSKTIVEAEQKEYTKPGGPFKYLENVILVIKCYLGQLKEEEQNESSKALHDFVGSKLERHEILSLVDGHAREHMKSREKITELEQQQSKTDAELQILQQEIKDLKTTHSSEKLTWTERFTGMKKESNQKDEALKQQEQAAKTNMENAQKDWDDARKDLVAQKEVLRVEKETMDKKCKEMMNAMTEIREEQRIRFKNLEDDLNKILDDKITFYMNMITEEREAHYNESKEQRDKYAKDVKELHQIIDDYEEQITLNQENAMKKMETLNDELQDEIHDIEKEFGESMVKWEKERIELKKELFLIGMQKDIAEHKITCLENKISSP